MGFFYRRLLRPLVFRLPPEFSHSLALTSFRPAPAWKLAGWLLAVSSGRLHTEVAGLQFPNPVGMAAGFDKDCKVLGPLLDAGFGYVVGGTVTLDPRPGNPGPRLLRDEGREALVNALGFPGGGLRHAEARLRRLSEARRARIIVSVSGTEEDDIAECHRTLEPLAAAIEINISSPNTAGLAVFQEPLRLSALVRRIAESKRRPLFIKLPRLADSAKVAELGVAAAGAGADGLVSANTLPVEDDRLRVGRGGLSGGPLFESTLALVREVRRSVPEPVAVIGCGGVSSGEQARALLDAGASAVQLYTALVYEGPGVAGAICRSLLRD